MNILATFGNLGGVDGLFILLIILLLFGAKRLPELARGLGSAVREFSKAKDEIEHEISRQPTAQPPPRIDQAPEAQAQIPPAQAQTAAPVTPAAAPSTVPVTPAAPVYHQEPQAHVPEAPHSNPPA
jgi:sec-independent protein translocase protein TatA